MFSICIMGKGIWLKECAFRVYLQLHVNLTWDHNLGLIIYLEKFYLSLEEGTWLKEHAFSFCCLNACWFWVHGLGSIISFDGYCLFYGGWGGIWFILHVWFAMYIPTKVMLLECHFQLNWNVVDVNILFISL
jgi:hypothetical protein